MAGGRPNRYKAEIEDKLVLVEAWARNGLTDAQIADNLGINVSTLYQYKKDYSEFRDAIKKGKEIVDEAVVGALLKRAMGYQYDEVSSEISVDAGGVIKKTTKTVRKELPPDVAAAFIWLKNRMPEVWRDQRKENSAEAINTLKAILAGVDAQMMASVEDDEDADAEAAEAQDGNGAGE